MRQSGWRTLSPHLNVGDTGLEPVASPVSAGRSEPTELITLCLGSENKLPYPWCARGESNPHAPKGTAPSRRRVYQFHHMRMATQTYNAYRALPNAN